MARGWAARCSKGEEGRAEEGEEEAGSQAQGASRCVEGEDQAGQGEHRLTNARKNKPHRDARDDGDAARNDAAPLPD